MSSNSSSKGMKRQSSVSKDKQVEEVVRKRRDTEEDEEEAEYENEEEAVVSAVTTQLRIKPIENMDKEMILRRIRQRKRVNKVRAAVGAFLSSPFTTSKGKGNNAFPVQQKRWVDDAFAAL